MCSVITSLYYLPRRVNQYYTTIPCSNGKKVYSKEHLGVLITYNNVNLLLELE